MRSQQRISKSRLNYYVDIVIFLPFLLLIITGVIMLAYHGGKPYIETVLNKDGNFWINAHIVFAVVSIVVIAVHLILHLSWFKKLFSGKLKNKFRIKNLILVIIFLLATITSLIPGFLWIIPKKKICYSEFIIN